jgi:protein-disulfide isomerase
MPKTAAHAVLRVRLAMSAQVGFVYKKSFHIMIKAFFGVFCLLGLLSRPALADVINYQGRLSLNGTPISGVNRFKFALIGEQGATVWTSEAIPLQVNNGVYAVRLGDSQQAPPIPVTVLQETSLKLRIWLDRNEKGWIPVGNDVPVSYEKPLSSSGGSGENRAILAELRDIHALLAGQQKNNQNNPPPEPPQIVTVSITGAPSLGKAEAPLVLIEFLDYQCPFCSRYQNDVFARLKTNYVDTGKLRVIACNLPLPFHSAAEPAARAAICATAQGKFWALRDQLFVTGRALSSEAISQAVQAAGMDAAKYAACTNDTATTETLLKDGQEAKEAGIEATPSFVLGRAVAGKVTGLKIIGAQPYPNFAAEIDKMLAAGGGP